MLYGVYDQLMILVGFEHLNGNNNNNDNDRSGSSGLSGSGLSGSGLSGQWDWFMAVCSTGWNGVMGLIPGGLPWGHATVAGSGWWDWWGCAMGACSTGWIGAIALIYGDASWGCATGSGDGIDWWGCAMGARDTGWIREIGLIHGGMRHWLDRGDSIDSWGHGHGVMRHWLDRGDGIDSWGWATLAGSGQWHWFMGTRHGGARLDRGDGIYLGARHGGAALAECGRWDWVMGACHGGVRLWSGWWNWSVEESHGGARRWLDLDDGIDLCGRAMGARDTGWIGAMGLIHGDVPNNKVIWLLDLNDDTTCPHVRRWGKCAECVW